MSKSTEKLLHCWHPVAYGRAVLPDAPYATKLLDEHLVIWRTADGTAHVMRDLCIHRGTALSLGWVKNDCIVCFLPRLGIQPRPSLCQNPSAGTLISFDTTPIRPYTYR